MTARQYVSGETYYIWGKQFFLEFKPSQKRAFKIDGNKIILETKAESTAEQRERFIREEFRKILIEQLNRLIPKWEETTGLYCIFSPKIPGIMQEFQKRQVLQLQRRLFHVFLLSRYKNGF